MKNIKALLLVLFLPLTVVATGQVGDILIWKGDTLTVFSNPLELRKDINSLRPKLFGIKEAGMNTGCWRGYVAEWEIIEDELYLTNLFSCSYYQDSVKADLKKVFGAAYKNGKVKASWVTGELLIPKGRLVHYVHQGYDSFYAYELVLSFRKGRLVGQKLYNNSMSHKSIYSENPDSLQKFIYATIDWQRVPNLNDKKERVILLIYSGKTTKPDSVRVVRGAENEILTNEAVRVVSMLPDWDVYYKRGKVYPMPWTMPIIFSEEKRKKYAR